MSNCIPGSARGRVSGADSVSRRWGALGLHMRHSECADSGFPHDATGATERFSTMEKEAVKHPCMV